MCCWPSNFDRGQGWILPLWLVLNGHPHQRWLPPLFVYSLPLPEAWSTGANTRTTHTCSLKSLVRWNAHPTWTPTPGSLCVCCSGVVSSPTSVGSTGAKEFTLKASDGVVKYVRDTHTWLCTFWVMFTCSWVFIFLLWFSKMSILGDWPQAPSSGPRSNAQVGVLL